MRRSIELLSATILLALGAEAQNLYVVSHGGTVTYHNAAAGAAIGRFGSEPVGPEGIALGPDGNLYVTSSYAHEILKYSPAGALLGSFVPPGSGGLSYPTGIVFGPDRNLYVVSNHTHSVIRYDGNTGALIGTFVATALGGLHYPYGLTFDTSGNLYVANLWREPGNQV